MLFVDLYLSCPAASIGGFCVDPGDCICRDGYFGDLCTENSKPPNGPHKECSFTVIPPSK